MGMSVRSGSAGESTPSAADLRENGFKCGTGEVGEEPAVRLKKLFCDTKGSGAGGEEETKKPYVVHLIKGLPPLPGKTVAKIQGGAFVEFAKFPVFDQGRREGEWMDERSERDSSGATKLSLSQKRKGPREVGKGLWTELILFA